jgi:hypothetical protein
MGNWPFPQRYSSQGVRPTTHLNLVLRFRMSVVIPPLPTYDFMAREETTFLFIKTYNNVTIVNNEKFMAHSSYDREVSPSCYKW